MDLFYVLLCGCLSVFLIAPRIFRKARQSCRKINANARSCTPHTIHSTLLERNSQKPQLRLNFFWEPTIQAAITVTTIAGHWIASRISISIRRSAAKSQRRCPASRPATRSVLPTDEHSCHTFRIALLPSLHRNTHATDASGIWHSAHTASSAPTFLCPFQPW